MAANHFKPITKYDLDLTMSMPELNLKIDECIKLIIALKVEAKGKSNPSIEYIHMLYKLDTIRLILLQELEERNKLIASINMQYNKWELKDNG
jgi:hypothetical protein